MHKSSDRYFGPIHKYDVFLNDKTYVMISAWANFLLYLLLLLFVSFACRQSGDENITEEFSDSTYIKKPPPDYRELSLSNRNYFLADSFYALRRLDLANPYYKQAALQFDQDSEFLKLIHTLNRLAWSEMILGNKVTASQFLTKAEELGVTHLNSDHVLWAETYRTKGNYDSNVGNYIESLESYETSLNIIEFNYGRRSLKAAEINLLIGYLYNWNIMDPYSAIDYYSKAIKILENVEASDQETFILCLYNLAVTYRKIGELNKAEIYAKQLLQNIDKENAAMFKYEEFGYSLLANIYKMQNKNNDAINCYKKAISLNRKETKYTDIHVVNYYNNLSRIYMEIDSANKGIDICMNAININNKLGLDSLYLSDSYDHFAYGLQQMEHKEMALDYMHKCVQIRRELFSENHEQTSKSYHTIGQYYYDIGEIDSSIFYLKKSVQSGCVDFQFVEEYSIPTMKQLGDNYYLVNPLNQIAEISKLKYKDSNNLDDLYFSFSLHLLCDSLIDNSRVLLEQEEAKLRYASEIQRIYENAINTGFLLYNENNNFEYFFYIYNIIEKNRARILLDNIQSADLVSTSIILDSILNEEKRHSYRVRYLNQLIAENDISESSLFVDSINSLLFSEMRELDKLNEYIKLTYPTYFQVHYNYHQHDYESLLTKFPNTSFIEYFWGKYALYAIRFDNNQRICHKIEITPKLINNINSIIKICSSEQGILEANPMHFAQHAYSLYNILLSPLLENILFQSENDKKYLIIIPDGLLSMLPFEALVKSISNKQMINYRNLDYLINEFDINYSFSTNYLLFNENQNNRNEIKNVLAYGYYFNESHPVIPENFNNIVSLPGTRKELDAISKHYKGKYIVGNDVKESSFKQLYNKYDVIHLALHGKYDSLRNYNTYLIFNSIEDSIEDGKLYNYELFPLKFNASLAVLSACETGLGKNNPGEGLLSMGWGFAYAGCKSLILSLWKADDRSTSIIMEQFYEKLSISNNINASLIEAKRQYLINADEHTAHPKYWAAFVNYGNIISSEAHKRYSIHFFVLIIILASLIIYFSWSRIRK